MLQNFLLRFWALPNSLHTVFPFLSISLHISVTHPLPFPCVSVPYAALLLHKKRLSIVSMHSPPNALSWGSRERQT